MKTKETKKSQLRIVKEIEARRPKVLTKEYSEEYLWAIRWLLIGHISEEDADEYYTTPDSVFKEYEKMYRNVERYIEEHF